MKTYRHLNIREITPEYSELKKEITRYPYLIAHMYSDILCGEGLQDKVNWDELVELRAFGENGELHIFEQNGAFKALEIQEKESCEADIVEKYYVVRKAICSMGKRCLLAVREYLEPDEDGQAVVVYTRPFKLEVKER